MENANDATTIAGLTPDANHKQIVARAKAMSERVTKIRDGYSSPSIQLAICIEYARANGIDPMFSSQVSKLGALERMSDASWWQRKIYRLVNQALEAHKIQCGKVHRFASAYVSQMTLNKRREAKRRSRRVLESLYLQNEEDTELPLTDVTDHSVSNPAIKRAELMCRIHGFEEYAKENNDVGVFLTFTCPSRMHARLSSCGKQNPRYNGTTPKEANLYLNKLWQRIRAKLKRQNIEVYGFRVTEPQHDGTPHWHLLLFTEKNKLSELISISRSYNLQDSPDEPGAQKHRFTAINIDWEKGNAAGYIAKYIAKNIDGEFIDTDKLGNDAKESAEKIEAWASVWNIRQFQQIGGAPVTIWRELRKANISTTPAELQEAVSAADDNNWHEFQNLANGVKAKRKSHALSLEKIWDDTPGKYGEPIGDTIFGVKGKRQTVQTRIHKWKITKESKVIAEGAMQTRTQRDARSPANFHTLEF